MISSNSKTAYPENGYLAIFPSPAFPDAESTGADIPPDAEETLAHVLGTLSQREADLFLLRYRDGLTFAQISERYGIATKERVRQILAKAERKLRHPSRSGILSMGLEAYLSSVAAENEEKKRGYSERIAALEELIRAQEADNARRENELRELEKRVDPAFAPVYSSIDVLDLSIRPWRCLVRAGVHTIKDILDYGDLMAIRNLGIKSVEEILEKVNAFLESHVSESCRDCNWRRLH